VVSSPSVAHALAQARELTPHEGLILVFGSMYLVGEALQALGELVL
jgi:dihydrofolate synthase/folylpolyglutamate synthase